MLTDGIFARDVEDHHDDGDGCEELEEEGIGEFGDDGCDDEDKHEQIEKWIFLAFILFVESLDNFLFV